MSPLDMMNVPPIKVAIIEENAKLRESLAILIDGESGFRCVGKHRTPERALCHLPLEKPDVVLMDIDWAVRPGVECVRKLRLAMPSLRIILHTVYEDAERLFKSLHAGAHGYLLKRTTPAKLLEAIAEVHGGGAPMTPRFARMVVEHFHQLDTVHAATDTDSLTSRETEILDSLSKGYRNKEIADRLGITVDTVRAHLRSIYEKLHVGSRTAAVRQYLNE